MAYHDGTKNDTTPLPSAKPDDDVDYGERLELVALERLGGFQVFGALHTVVDERYDPPSVVLSTLCNNWTYIVQRRVT